MKLKDLERYIDKELLSLGLDRNSSPTSTDYYYEGVRLINVELKPSLTVNSLPTNINKLEDDKLRNAIITLLNEITLFK